MTTDGAARWQNRVVAYKRLRIGDLAANLQNWRTHPDTQRTAITGYLRRRLDSDAEWDVAIVDLDENEERLGLASIDPITVTAEMDADAFAALMGQVEAESEVMQAMLASMAHRAGIDLTPYADTAPLLPENPDTDDFWCASDPWVIESCWYRR